MTSLLTGNLCTGISKHIIKDGVYFEASRHHFLMKLLQERLFKLILTVSNGISAMLAACLCIRKYLRTTGPLRINVKRIPGLGIE